MLNGNLFLILHLSFCFFFGSGINWKSSTKLTLVAAAEEGKNNNNNSPVHLNVQCWKNHAARPSSSCNNSLNSGCDSNIATDVKNINNNNMRSGVSSNIAAYDSIISDPLSGRGSQQRKEDLVRDPVVTLNSNGSDWKLPEPGVSEAQEDTA